MRAMGDVFISEAMEIEPEWIDYNGHLNMAYYSVLFDRGVDAVWEHFGLGPTYMQARGMTTYAAEFHIRYLRELKLGDRVRASFQIIGHDAKRIHSWQELIHEDGWIAASGENLHLSVDTTGPKVAAFPDDVLEKIAGLAADHADLARPEALGRPIGIGARQR